MRRAQHRWKSRHLGHDMDLLVFGESGLCVFAFPIRITSFAMYEKHGIVRALEPYWSRGHIQLYCIDAVDDFSYDVTRRLEVLELQEKYILEELLPLAEELNPGAGLATFGICMGGFHAVDLAFRNLGVFSKVVALSGRYDLTVDMPGHKALLSKQGGAASFWHTPTAYLHRLGARIRKSDIDVVLGVGRNDPFYKSNIELYRILKELDVAVELHTWGGAPRRGRFWRTLAAHSFTQ